MSACSFKASTDLFTCYDGIFLTLILVLSVKCTGEKMGKQFHSIKAAQIELLVLWWKLGPRLCAESRRLRATSVSDVKLLLVW